MGLKSFAVLMVIVACWWLIRKWSRPQYPAAQGKSANLNRRATDTTTQRSTEGNTLKPHDLELRRLQSESQTLRLKLEQANVEITNLRDQLATSPVTKSGSPAAKPANKESLADPENA